MLRSSTPLYSTLLYAEGLLTRKYVGELKGLYASKSSKSIIIAIH